MSRKFNIQLFTSVTACSLYCVGAKLSSDFVYVLKKDEVAVFAIGLYLLLIIITGWISDYGSSIPNIKEVPKR